MGKEQKNKKDCEKIKRKNLGLKIIICLVVGILVLLAVIICIICGVKAYIQGEPIKMSDWLMAGCALLSMFGTIFLACVSVIQSDRANKLNEQVIMQNEKLQSINDMQFRIANQNSFPYLYGSASAVHNSSVSKKFTTDGWMRGCDRTIEKNPKVMIEIDSRWNKNKDAQYLAIAECILENKSSVSIHCIEICNISIGNPFNNIHSVSWVLTNSILCIDDKITIYFQFYHDLAEFTNGDYDLAFSIILKMRTITGVIFLEKLYFNVSKLYGYCQVDNLKMEEI